MTLLKDENSLSRPTAAALGIFDGVHKGHRCVLDKALSFKNKGLVPVVFTFDVESITRKHGREYKYIYGEGQKCRILEDMGFEFVYSPEMQNLCDMNGEEFVRKILLEKLCVKVVVCGENFRFGKNAAWGAKELLEFGKRFGFEVLTESLAEEHGKICSSELVKSCLNDGNLEKLSEFGMEKYFILKPVITGNRIGRTINFPTINQAFGEHQLVPKKGVYATVTYIDGKTYRSITNIGVKPTVEKNAKPLAETHILDFSGDLYGRTIKVEFEGFIRGERKFSSLEELKKQINSDIDFVRG